VLRCFVVPTATVPVFTWTSEPWLVFFMPKTGSPLDRDSGVPHDEDGVRLSGAALGAFRDAARRRARQKLQNDGALARLRRQLGIDDIGGAARDHARECRHAAPNPDWMVIFPLRRTPIQPRTEADSSNAMLQFAEPGQGHPLLAASRRK